jgi:hypothetical protein
MSKRKKAQIEFIYITAIIAALVIVIAYTSLRTSKPGEGIFPGTPGKIPTSVEEEMKMVEDYLINFMRESTYETVKILERRGGYLDAGEFEAGGFTFMNDDVPYWEICGNLHIPPKEDVKNRLERKTEEYIKVHREKIENLFGKDVMFDFDKLRVEANILDNKIDFKVFFPTTVKNYSIEQPYKFSLVTELGRIYDFSRDFAISQANERYFEYFTIAGIYTSRIIDEHPALPTVEDMHSCDERIDRNRGTLNRYLEKIIKHALTNVLWWVPMPNQAGSGFTKTFSIENVNGKKYPDLNEPGPRYNITFTLPDDFSIEFTSEIHVSPGNPRSFIEITCCGLDDTRCIRTYNFNYPFKFPVNVRIYDKLLKQYFNFGVMAAINNNMLPGGC